MQFALTCLGEPINMTEYTTCIAGNQSARVLLIDDFQSDSYSMLESQHVDAVTDFESIVLEDRKGRQRLYYGQSTPIEKMHKYYSNLKNKEKVNIFLFPETFKKACNAFKNWPTV